MFETEIITRRTFIKGTAIASGLVLSSGLLRSFYAGVFSTSEGPAYEAWTNLPANKTDNPLDLVRAAILAANGHNTQPWFFKIGNHSIDIIADMSRSIGSIDPYFRELYMSLGCALENLAIAAERQGYSYHLTYFPEKSNDENVVKITLFPGDPTDSNLYDVIPERHMNRGPYDKNRLIPKELLSALNGLNRDTSDVKLFIFDESQDKVKIGNAMIQATEALIADKEQASDSGKWMRQTWDSVQKYRDGLTIDSQGLPTLIRFMAKMLPPQSQEKNDEFWLDAVKEKHVETAAAFGLIAVKDLSNYEQILKAGQLWQRMHLWATTKGLGMHIMNQLSERRDRELVLNLSPHFGNLLKNIVGNSEWQSVIQFRMGYPTLEALPSPRRDIKDVLQSIN